jgi:hypothetical protein
LSSVLRESPAVRLFTARLDRGNFSQIGWKRVRGECFDIHFDKADEGAAKVRTFPATPIYDHPDAGHLSTARPHDVDSLLHAAAAGNDVFRDNEFFAGRDGEAAPQDQTASFFFDEDVSFAQGPADFLTHNDPAQRGRNHGVALNALQLVRETSADIRGNFRVLEEQSTLEKLPAMKAGTKNEMAVEKRASPAEKRKQILAH